MNVCVYVCVCVYYALYDYVYLFFVLFVYNYTVSLYVEKKKVEEERISSGW